MKTQDELLEHYWSVIVPMARDHVIKPWECVRHVNEDKFTDHPKFEGKPWNYTFALTVLEGKPVFVGDKLYHKGTEFIVVDCNEKQSFADCTWTPPTKKRTFVLELTEQELVILGEIPLEQRFFDYPETMTLISKVRTLLDDRSKQNGM